ncbi:hypothetical protein OHS59_10165 [Streptomyces sp. NBC_00414]|uniref:hypothetical protein n=1 Tax=Streptomyces sp. NBC_00414 TaxID=2975739 RepID=UPI002E1B7262
MDSYEGIATLEWWANRSTCLRRAGVRVEVRVVGGDWTCDAILDPPLPPEDRESFAFLIQLDPFFTPRFDEESALPVRVVAAGEDGRLVLTGARADTASAVRTPGLPCGDVQFGRRHCPAVPDLGISSRREPVARVPGGHFVQ